MSKARELALVVAKARQDILNRTTVRHCREIYTEIIAQASTWCWLGACSIGGTVELDPNEKYDVGTIINQMKLKLEFEEFENVKVFIDLQDSYVEEGQERTTLGFTFTIPEVELSQPLQTDFEF